MALKGEVITYLKLVYILPLIHPQQLETVGVHEIKCVFKLMVRPPTAISWKGPWALHSELSPLISITSRMLMALLRWHWPHCFLGDSLALCFPTGPQNHISSFQTKMKQK